MSLGADIEHRDETRCTPLHHAVVGGSVDTVRWILQAGADVNAVNDWFGTPLCLAAIKGNLAITELLIEHHADLNQDCFNLGSAAHAACASGELAIVQAVRAAGVSWNTHRNTCVDALSYLSQLPQNDRSLVPYHMSLATETCQSQSPGAIAVRFRHPRVVVFCLGLKNGLSVNETWKMLQITSGPYYEVYTCDVTLVTLAMSTLDHTTGEVLLTNGADANVPDSIGRGALIHVVDATYLEVNRGDLAACVGLLLRHGVNINSSHERVGRASFHPRWYEMARYPMTYNPKVVALQTLWLTNPSTSMFNTRPSDLAEGHETALMHVINLADNLSSCKHCVEVLCEHGADVNLLNYAGKSAMNMATTRFKGEGEQEVTSILLRHHATPEHPLRFMDCKVLPNYGHWQGVLVRPA
jgi:ankyrin repeat protein